MVRDAEVYGSSPSGHVELDYEMVPTPLDVHSSAYTPLPAPQDAEGDGSIAWGHVELDEEMVELDGEVDLDHNVGLDHEMVESESEDDVRANPETCDAMASKVGRGRSLAHGHDRVYAVVSF